MGQGLDDFLSAFSPTRISNGIRGSICRHRTMRCCFAHFQTQGEEEHFMGGVLASP